jgi:hypothetical protein
MRRHDPCRVLAKAGVNLDAEAEDEGTESGMTAQGQQNILSKPCLNEFKSAPTAFHLQMES